MEALAAAGLGLDYAQIRLCRTTSAWLAAGEQLRDHVAVALGSSCVGVEVIGSSSVLGLLAKPILDLAVGVSTESEFTQVQVTLVNEGWIYRGNAGDDGGQVFVLESAPWHRVAHLHAVEHGGAQWRAYLLLRDLLRVDADARQRYEAAKIALAERHADDRAAYTDGKSGIVADLLSTAGRRWRAG